jgi:hypothetical protein
MWLILMKPIFAYIALEFESNFTICISGKIY